MATGHRMKKMVLKVSLMRQPIPFGSGMMSDKHGRSGNSGVAACEKDAEKEKVRVVVLVENHDSEPSEGQKVLEEDSQLKAVLTARSHGTITMKMQTTTKVTLNGQKVRKEEKVVASSVVRVALVPRAPEKVKKDKKARSLREKERLTHSKLSGHSLKNKSHVTLTLNQ